MNTKSIAIAIALAAGTAFAASVQASDIPTLETVQVRPSADQLAQAERERTSAIPTLSAVQVRPTAGQIAERNAELAAAQPMVTLAAIQVRPTREQRDALAAETAHDNRVHATTLAMATALGHWVVAVPALRIRPGSLSLQSLAINVAADLLGR